ncbi:hypothetical protein C0J52_07540 [Blattella germanica]|nr:hypothetical protein C0J52_07540 [Blattella germanica]
MTYFSVNHFLFIIGHSLYHSTHPLCCGNRLVISPEGLMSKHSKMICYGKEKDYIVRLQKESH